MPAVLLEIGFVTGADDAPLLETDAYRSLTAQAIARGSATVLGGGLLDLGKRSLTIFSDGQHLTDAQLLPAYALVFLSQAAGMLGAIALLNRVNVHEFQMTAKDAIAAAMANDAD